MNKSLSKENNELRDYVKTAQQFLGGMRLDSPVHDNRIQQQSGLTGVYIQNETETSGKPF